MHVEPRLSITRLESIIRAQRNARLLKRFQAILLAMRGRTANEAAEDLCVSRRSVQEWVRRFNKGGPEALPDKPKPGKPRTLEPEQEAQVARWIDRGPGDPGLSAWNGSLVRDRIEEHFGESMSLSATYDLLHRLGFEPLRPRPQHRKSDPEAMRAWEERAPFLSGTSAERIPTRRSKSGSRMKPGSASRAR